MILLNMRRIIQFMVPMLLLNFSSYAIELFGYRLYEDISQYLNDGEVSYKKDSIDHIFIDEDRVLISNKYLNQYKIKSTKSGNIFEIHGLNNQLNLSPVECLDVQNKFIVSFEKRNAELFSTNIKQFPNKLKSKITWEIYLEEKTNKNELIFSVTCDFSFNNRRMEIILSDINFFNIENEIFDSEEDIQRQSLDKKVIDTSGI
jgi:hypothetical protein